MENKHTIYLNMCHHYRKVLNAKPCVDTSPPKMYQLKTNNQWKYNRATPVFHSKIASPDVKKHFQQDLVLKENNTPTICQYYYQHHMKGIESAKLSKSYVVPKKPFSPAILKSEAQSKLRNLRVYHPPRKKRVVLKASDTSQSSQIKRDDMKEENSNNRIFDQSIIKNTKLLSFAPIDKSYSEESSEDSAYNESECILSGDSRGSTPQQANLTHQLTKKLPVPTENSDKSIKLANTSTKNAADDIAYIQFLRDITNDILKKNIFTNKALRSVFQYHIQINKYELDSEKMMKKVRKLQDRLGVPKHDKFDDEDYGLGEDVYEDEIQSAKIIKNEENGFTSLVSDSSSSISTKEKENNEKQNVEKNVDDDFDENYSDSFSDVDNSYVSQSDPLKNVQDDDNNTDDNDIDSVSNAEVNEEDSEISLVTEKNNIKTASNSEIDSDLEISEEC